MSTDPLDGRSKQLFALARQEAPSEETRRRIAAALRAEPPPALSFKAARFPSARLWVPLMLAAAVFGVLALVLRNAGPETFDISAEPLAPDVARRETEKSVAQKVPSAQDSAAPRPLRSEEKSAVLPASPRKGVKAPPPSLEEELAGMQRARTALDRGDGAAALSELSAFERGPGVRKLAVEANLLRIEALAQVGRTDEAREEARRFVEKNPNNPLVDRAQKFTQPPARPDIHDSIKSEPVKAESD